VQFLPGYCVLITDDPGADRPADLPRPARLAFLADMDTLGEAVQRVCTRRDPAFRRVNYEILGNKDAFLHAHVWPRYAWEPADLRGGPVWGYPDHLRRTALSPEHDGLRAELAEMLTSLGS
jgi:diadenosine tetraphosphate (Ap4A) HIT family hydrolase